MLRSRIVPCLLMSNGGLVKTQKFKDAKYVGDPLNAVKIFNEKQVDELIFIDIDASVAGREPEFDRLRGIAVESRMPLCYGGGVSNAAQASRLIGLGFEKVSVSSAAFARPQLIREMADAVGSQSVVLTIDVRANGLLRGHTIYTHNGRRKQKLALADFCAQAAELGAGEIIINSIDRDGMMKGYDLNLARQVRKMFDGPLSFVGGAGSIQDMQDLIDAVGVVGAAAGSLFVFKGQFRAVLINYQRPTDLFGSGR
ncbi:imidazole glycerol phosphate synthase [Devosia limi DSM 17137]|uniref:Imidazole glycerol phosphate synthase subunit HisF n=1 Tax=Devosia limi DSM 17137 TaxID=1121477 RepID=A0A0F5LAT3_9HYPH|nr:AglZ/HisF2 family acetamidino modification protein [Devosia limi]KKB79395.1 imidazole glycerol phosphate synthase [Devosia limi DSM 17137]SHF31663.1 cyclase [Devosia limi DSM 17137]